MKTSTPPRPLRCELCRCAAPSGPHGHGVDIRANKRNGTLCKACRAEIRDTRRFLRGEE